MKSFLLIFSLLAGLSLSLSSKEHVNIILIVVDDLGYVDLSCIGEANDVSTPNIDHLAKNGVRFTNAYAMAPICNASRISMATGSYHQRQGQFWYGGPGLHKTEYLTIAECLKKKGYTCGYVGKFHHGSSDSPQKRGFPLNHGFDTFFGFSGGTKHFLNHANKYTGKMDKLHQGPMYIEDKKEDIEGFTTELFGQRARSFIEKNKEDKFFLQLSFNAVHNFTHQLPKSYLKEKGLKGFEDMKEKENYWKWRQKIGYPAHPEGRDYYLGQLYFLDREIGLLMKHLDEFQLTDKTAIIFVSDNGGSLVTYANNGSLSGGKYTLFEGGLRVPMIVSYPSMFQKGKVSQAMVSTMDLLPTVCSIAGAEIPGNIDGLNLKHHLISNAELKRGALYFDTKHQQAVRKGDWKLLITNKQPNQKLQISPTPRGAFLYNLKNDPGEKQNLMEKYPEKFKELSKMLKVWQESL